MAGPTRYKVLPLADKIRSLEECIVKYPQKTIAIADSHLSIENGVQAHAFVCVTPKGADDRFGFLTRDCYGLQRETIGSLSLMKAEKFK